MSEKVHVRRHGIYGCPIYMWKGVSWYVDFCNGKPEWYSQKAGQISWGHRAGVEPPVEVMNQVWWNEDVRSLLERMP